jgi:sugar (pentulose or hexulose) kinase
VAAWRRFRERVRGRRSFAPAGANLDGGHMAPKMRWQLDLARAGGRRRVSIEPVSYLVERLTGEAVMDHGLASTTSSMISRPADFAD